MIIDGQVLNLEALQYLANCIKKVNSLPELLNDVSVSQQTTFSSYRVSELLLSLQSDMEAYTNSAIGGLTHLKKEIVTALPDVADAEENVLYLLEDTSGTDTVYQQYLLINGTFESLGSTSTDLTNYYTKDESDAKFALLADLQTLISVIGSISELKTTEKDTLVNAINSLKEELDEKEVDKEITWAEYQALSEAEKNDGTVYYIPDMPVSTGEVAQLKQVVLFDGGFETTGNITLTESALNYSIIVFEYSISNLGNRYKQFRNFHVINNSLDTNEEAYTFNHGNGDTGKYVAFHFSSDGKTVIVDQNQGTMKIFRIIGVK